MGLPCIPVSNRLCALWHCVAGRIRKGARKTVSGI